jgi:membrane protein YdbS with pleckstrin-like domain
MNCPNCGAQLAPGVRFCGACGARVDANTAANMLTDDEQTRLSRDDEATRVARDAEATRVAARSPFDGSEVSPARVERLGATQDSPSVARMREPQAISRPQVSQVPSRATDADAERVIFSVRPTMLFIGLGYVLAAVAAVGLTVLLAKFNLLSALYSVLVSLPLLLIPAYYHLRRNTIKYTLTDSKIEIDQGLIARRTRNIPLRTIQDVTVSATIPQRILGFGDLIIENASEIGGTTTMHNIPALRRRADELLRELRRWN